MRAGARARAALALLVLATLTPVAAVVATMQLQPGLVRFALVAATLFLAPGYVAQAALFPMHLARPGGLERAALSLGLSIATAALAATLLDIVSAAATGAANRLLVVLAVVTLGLGIVAAARGRLGFPLLKAPAPPTPGARVGWHGFAVAGAASLMVGVGVAQVLDAPSAEQRSQLPFTEFFLTTPDGVLGELPTEVARGEPLDVVVHVVSHERAPRLFGLAVRDGSTMLANASLSVEPGETWTWELRLPTEEAGDHRFVLTLADESGATYRTLTLPITVRDR